MQTCFTTQVQLDALDNLYNDKDDGYEDLKLGIEVLELIFYDPWFTRAWILQEATSAGQHIDLLIRYDPALSITGWGDRFGELEFDVSEDFLQLFTHAAEHLTRYQTTVSTNIHAFQTGMIEKLNEDEDLNATLERFQEISDLSDKHKGAMLRLLQHSPNDQWTARIPTHRITCNAATANYFLANSFNSKPSDRLAILANICQYSIRIDTTKVREKGYNLNTCLLTLSLLNGDLSLLVGLERSVWRQASPYSSGFSWLPPASTDLRPAKINTWMEGDEFFRLTDHKITSEGMSFLGILWDIASHVNLSELQAKYKPLFATHLASQKRKYQDCIDSGFVQDEKELVDKEDEADLDRMCLEITWLLLKTLSDRGLPALADAVWFSLRAKARVFSETQEQDIRTRHANQNELSTIDDWIDQNVELDLLPESYAALTNEDLGHDTHLLGRPWHPKAGQANHPTRKVTP